MYAVASTSLFALLSASPSRPGRAPPGTQETGKKLQKLGGQVHQGEEQRERMEGGGGG